MSNLSINDHIHDVHHACINPLDCHKHDYTANEKEITLAKRLMQAKEICNQQGIRFTKLREQVYKLILQASKPLGAYDILNMMQQEQLKSSKIQKNVAPPTVYRSLEFLLQYGFIHQLTSINAFIPCCHPRDNHIAGFLICKKCEHVQEYSTEELQKLIIKTEINIGFTVENTVIEMSGICKSCQNQT